LCGGKCENASLRTGRHVRRLKSLSFTRRESALLVAAALVSLLPAPASAQWRWWPFRPWGRYDEDYYRLRRDIEEEAERQRLLQKQEYTRSTVRKPPTPVSSSPIEGLRDRYLLLEIRIAKLQADRAAAVGEGKNAAEIAAIDSRIEALRLQANTLKDALGPAR